MPKNVLVVEDDALSQFVIVEMCRELGFECLTANNGKEAVELVAANANEISVILMDIHMPVISGLDATQIIRNEPNDPPKNLPVVATTADVQWHSPVRCQDHGFTSVLPKPLNFNALSGILDRFAG